LETRLFSCFNGLMRPGGRPQIGRAGYADPVDHFLSCMLTEGARLFKRVAFMMIYTRKALGLGQPLAKDEGLWWGPLLQQIESLTRHRRLETSGIAALRSFTDIWDERMRQVTTGEDRPVFSPAQITAMTESLAKYEPWP